VLVIEMRVDRRGVAFMRIKRSMLLIGLLILPFVAPLMRAAEVRLAWDAPTDAAGSPVKDLAGFLVYYGTESGIYTGMVDVGMETTAVLQELDPRMTYYIAVKSYDRSGIRSAATEELSWAFDANASGLPAESEIMSPSGGHNVTNRRPAFTWTAMAGATWYQLHIHRNGATYQMPWVQGATAWTPPSDLSAGRYSWWVRAWGPVIGYGSWSPRADFTVAAMVPGVIAQIGSSDVQGGGNPVFRWTKDSRATWYRLWVSHPGGGAWHDKWYAMSGTGEGSVTVNGHPGGSSTWWIQGWGADGTGPWAGPMAFSTPDPAPAMPTMIGPLGTTTSPVTFQYASARATWFRIYVSRSGTVVLDKWTESATLHTGVLGRGTYSWWVAGWNAVSGKTVWSEQGTFTIP